MSPFMRQLTVAALCLAALSVGDAVRIAAAQDPQAPGPGAGARQNPGVRQGQPPRPGPRGNALPGRRAGERTPQQLDQAFDRFMVAQARNALQLTDEQVPAFGPRLQRLQMTRRRAQRQRRQLVQQMTALSQNGGAMDDQTVAAKLKALDDQAARADAEIRQAYQEIDALLTPQQRLRFRAFEVRMEQRKLELISRAREAAGPQPPPAP
jgi:hypothetical protein